jgi:regulator of cell morphogenesis and NO signaling
MHHFTTTKMSPSMKIAGQIDANPRLLLMLQHFKVDFRVRDLTVSQLCKEYCISETLFVDIANLYNGFGAKKNHTYTKNDLLQVIDFLKNSHHYYRFEMYPQIKSYILKLQENHPEKELKLLEKFFNEYFTEVREHLDYEDNVAFPYFIKLLQNIDDGDTPQEYSSIEYSEHHTDIELKLHDLKNLLLKYVKIDNDLDLRRKLFFALYELEYDLFVHSLIEESILIPSGVNIEKKENA